MKKQLLKSIVLFVSINFVVSGAEFPSHLIQVLEVVKNIDNGLKDTKFQILAAENQRRSSRGILLPQINARTYTNLEMTDRLADDWNHTNIRLTFEQTIFSKAEFESYGQSKKRVQLADAVHDENKQNLFLRTITAYVDFIRLTKLAANAKQNVKNFESHYNASRRRNRSGAVSKTDVIKSEERLVNSQTEHFDIEFQLKAKKDEIFQLTRMEAKPSWVKPKFKNFKKKLSEYLNKKISVKSNTNIRQIASETEVAKSQYRIQKSRHLPKLSLFALYDKDYSHEHDIVHTYVSSIGLQITMPLFTGGNIHYGKKSAFESYQASQYRLNDTVLKTQREFHTALDNLEVRERIAKMNEKSMNLSRRSLKGIEREFLNGTKTSLDVLESKEDLNSIVKRSVTNEFEIILQKFRVLKLVGLLDLNHIKRLVK